MGGFKEGTVNGWDDEENDESEPEANTPADERSRDDDERESDPVSIETGTEESEKGGNGTMTSEIPWILCRNSITDGRDQTVQIHLREETTNIQRTQKSIIESRLGESVRKADLREAALLVGLQHTDDVVDVLEEWGYAFE